MGNICASPSNVDVDLESVLSRRVSRKDSGFTETVKKHAQFKEVYKMGRTIGTGGFSVVKLVTDRVTDDTWACKIMTLPPAGRKAGEGESTREEILKEIGILMSLKHPHIIYLKEYFEEAGRVYIIMEYLEGGELLEALLAKGREARYTEEDARVIFNQLIQGVKYMHDKGIVHRDLKLENLLLTRKGDIGAVKIADFGLAKKYAQSSLSTICGTPHYVAPEVIKGGDTPYTYGKECDLWSCGIVLFILLGGYPPFYDESEPLLFRKIRDGKYDMDDPVWNDVSAEAKDLIANLLQVDPEKRLTVQGVLQHPWMLQEDRAAKRKDLLGTVSKMRSSMRLRGLPPPEVLGLNDGADGVDAKQ